jgi:hypothetical protein
VLFPDACGPTRRTKAMGTASEVTKTGYALRAGAPSGSLASRSATAVRPARGSATVYVPPEGRLRLLLVAVGRGMATVRCPPTDRGRWADGRSVRIIPLLTGACCLGDAELGTLPRPTDGWAGVGCDRGGHLAGLRPHLSPRHGRSEPSWPDDPKGANSGEGKGCLLSGVSVLNPTRDGLARPDSPSLASASRASAGSGGRVNTLPSAAAGGTATAPG